jgi:hypoxanthine phosphoribosyltransferase
VRRLHRYGKDIALDFIVASSYAGKTDSSGKVSIIADSTAKTSGKNVLIIDDILDSGRTLTIVRKHILSHNPATVRTCVLLNKRDARVVPFEADFTGFEIPNVFVAGYGLDYNNRLRELPAIYEVKV